MGCISPMNAVNRLSKPAYFIPDPWTDTKPDNSFWSRAVHDLIRQVVNDNTSKKITIKSFCILVLVLLRFISFKSYGLMARLTL